MYEEQNLNFYRTQEVTQFQMQNDTVDFDNGTAGEASGFFEEFRHSKSPKRPAMIT